MENKNDVILNQENIAVTENKNNYYFEITNENVDKTISENEDFSISERTMRIIKNRNKRRNKIRMNFLYKIGFILFIIAIGFLITAMVICLVENSVDHDSFLAILFSIISAALALLGIIFTCVSKEKSPKKRRVKSKRFNDDKQVID